MLWAVTTGWTPRSCRLISMGYHHMPSTPSSLQRAPLPAAPAAVRSRPRWSKRLLKNKTHRHLCRLSAARQFSYGGILLLT